MSAIVENLPCRENNDIRLKTVIERDTLSVLKPFDFMQSLYILSKYQIRDGFIIPNRFLYYVFSGIWSLILLIGYFFSNFARILNATLEGSNFIKCFSNVQIFSVYLLGNLLIYFTNVTQRLDNVLLAINIQNICKMVKVESLNIFSLFNWIYIIALICFQILWILYFTYSFSNIFSIGETITNMFFIIFDIQMLYPSRFLKLMLESLREWLDDAKKSNFVSELESEFYWNRKFIAYVEIVEAYEIIGESFQSLILYFIFDTFINSVLAIWIRIELAKVIGSSLITVTLSLTSLFWIVKNIALITYLCLECERFYMLLKEIRSTCIQLVTLESCSEIQKRICKNIKRVQITSFKKMSACGLFVIDAAMPLRLFGLLTTYIIVVLQFEFL